MGVSALWAAGGGLAGRERDPVHHLQDHQLRARCDSGSRVRRPAWRADPHRRGVGPSSQRRLRSLAQSDRCALGQHWPHQPVSHPPARWRASAVLRPGGGPPPALERAGAGDWLPHWTDAGPDADDVCHFQRFSDCATVDRVRLILRRGEAILPLPRFGLNR